MMTSIFMGFVASAVMLALGFSIVSLFLHWKRRDEHPDTADLRERVAGLGNEIIDLQDRVGQWMKRDSVRKARQGKEKASQAVEDDNPGPISLADRKRELRARAAALRGES